MTTRQQLSLQQRREIVLIAVQHLFCSKLTPKTLNHANERLHVRVCVCEFGVSPE